jgi:hypothetical protein
MSDETTFPQQPQSKTKPNSVCKHNVRKGFRQPYSEDWAFVREQKSLDTPSNRNRAGDLSVNCFSITAERDIQLHHRGFMDGMGRVTIDIVFKKLTMISIKHFIHIHHSYRV